MNYRRWGIAIAFLAALAGGRTALAATLEEAMENVAKSVARELRKGAIERVHVPTPDGPPNDAAGGLLRRTFVAALERAADIEVTHRLPDTTCLLEYGRAEKSSRYDASIELRGRDGQSLARFKFEFEIDDIEDRVTLEGANFDATVGPDGATQPATQRNIELKLRDEPAADVSGDRYSIVSPVRGSKFRVEILTKDEGEYRPRPVRVLQGIPFTELDDGEVYAVKVFNDADHEVAVDLSIDGVNTWALSRNPGFRKIGKFVLPAKSSTVVKGWHVGEPGRGEVVEFVPRPSQESIVASASVGGGRIGQVSARFYAAARAGEQMPQVEPVPTSTTSGVGRGVPVEPTMQPRAVFIGPSVLAAVTVRYVRDGTVPTVPSPPGMVDSPLLLLRTSAYRGRDIGRRAPLKPLPSEQAEKPRRDEFGVRVHPFEEREPEAAPDRVAVEGAGEMAALWLATRLEEAGFRAAVGLDADPELKKAVKEDRDVAPAADGLWFLLDGTITLHVGRRLNRADRTVTFVATLRASTRLRHPDADEPLHEGTYAPTPVERTAKPTELDAKRTEAIRAALDAFAAGFLADAQLDTRLPEAMSARRAP